MVCAIAATALCGVLLFAGPDRRNPRAWIALGLMLATLVVALAGSTAHLLAGAVALLAAPAVVAGVPRHAMLPALHRAAALLAMAGCLLGAGSAVPDAHHGSPGVGFVLLGGYLAVAALAATHESRRAGKAAPRFAAGGEVGVMAAGMVAMTLLG